MYDSLIIAASLVYLVALFAELQLTGEDAGKTPPLRLAAIFTGLAVSAALVVTAEVAVAARHRAGSGEGLLAKGVGLAAEYLPSLLVVTTILTSVDVIRTVRARRKADEHISTPGRPKLPEA